MIALRLAGPGRLGDPIMLMASVCGGCNNHENELPTSSNKFKWVKRTHIGRNRPSGTNSIEPSFLTFTLRVVKVQHVRRSSDVRRIAASLTCQLLVALSHQRGGCNNGWNPHIFSVFVCSVTKGSGEVKNLQSSLSSHHVILCGFPVGESHAIY